MFRFKYTKRNEYQGAQKSIDRRNEIRNTCFFLLLFSSFFFFFFWFFFLLFSFGLLIFLDSVHHSVPLFGLVCITLSDLFLIRMAVWQTINFEQPHRDFEWKANRKTPTHSFWFNVFVRAVDKAHTTISTARCEGIYPECYIYENVE